MIVNIKELSFLLSKHRDKFFLISIFLLSLRIFFHLGEIEIQPWDEGLYAVRIASVLNFSAWLDQTAYSIGGLYTAAHPPLFIWLSALTGKVFGLNLITIRIWSALFGYFSIILTCFLPENRRAGFFAAFILANLEFYLYYCQRGQLDITYTFFIIFSIFAWRQFERTDKYYWLFLCGTGYGLAQMSKIIVGLFVPMILGLYLFIMIVNKKHHFSTAIKQWLVVFTVGALIALPWHLYMLVKHGHEFIDYFFYFHIIKRSITGVESNVPALGKLYFINQTVVLMTIAAAAFIWQAGAMIKKKNREQIFYFSMFIVPFFIFTLSATKLKTYLIPEFFPIALLAGIKLEQIWQDKKIEFPLLVAMVIFAIWASIPEIRLTYKASDNQPFLLIVGAGGLLALIGLLYVCQRMLSAKTIIIIGLLFIFANSFKSSVEDRVTGIEQIAKKFEAESCRNLIYVDSAGLVNPQISFYFQGIDLGWDDRRHFIRLSPDEFDMALLPNNELSYVIINQYSKIPLSAANEMLLQKEAILLLKNEFYHVFKTLQVE